MLNVASSERSPADGSTSASGAFARWLPDWALGAAVWLIPALVALVVGRWGLRETSIDRDETATIDISTRSIHDIFRTLPHVDAVHGLYYLIMHYWIAAFGTSAQSIRLPSLIGTVIAAAVLAVLGTKLVSRRVGFTAGLLYAVAPQISFYAHDARSYGIDSTFVILLVLCLVHAMSSPRRRAWVPYGLVLIVMVTSHLFTLLVVPAQAVTIAWYAFAERSWRPVRRWIATSAIALAVLSPFVYRAIDQGSTASWIPKPTLSTARTFVVNISGGRLLVIPILLFAAFGVFLSFRARSTDSARPVAGSGNSAGSGRTATRPVGGDVPPLSRAVTRRAPRHRAAAVTLNRPTVAHVALPWLVIPPVLLLVASLRDPLYVFRYVLYTLPALMLLAAYGLSRLRLILFVPVLAALVALTIPMALAVRSPTQGANDLRGEAAYLTANKQPGDAIVFLVPIQRQMMSSYPAAYAGLNDVDRKLSGAQAANFFGTDVSHRVLQQRLRTIDRVWAVKYWVTKASRPAAHVIERQRYAMFKTAGLKWVSTRHFRGGAILLFARKPG